MMSAATVAALKLHEDGVGRMSSVQAVMIAIAGPSVSGLPNLIGGYPGLGAMRRVNITKLAGMDLHVVNGGLAAAAAVKFDDGVGGMLGLQDAMNAIAGPNFSGMLGGDNAARFGMNWANGELGRHLHGLTGLVSAGRAMID